MATISEMQDLLSSFSSSSIDIPGLDVESIAEPYTRYTYKKQIENLGDKGEELVSNMKQYYLTDGKMLLENKINNLKTGVENVKSGVEELTKTVTTIGAQALVPSVLTVGSATSTANPAYVILENKNKVGMLKTALNGITYSARTVLTAAIELGFELPTPVILILQSVSTLRNLINRIPV
mgnify:CR=1 FL=1